MKFTSANTIIYSSQSDYEHKLFMKELAELEAEFDKIMLIQSVAESYTGKHNKRVKNKPK